MTVDGQLASLGTFATPREAIAALGHVDAAEKVIDASSEVTFRQLSEQWWETRSGHRPSTRARDRVALDHDIIPSFGDRIVQSVSYADVQRWVNDLAKRVSPRSVRRILVVLAQLFELAGITNSGRVRLDAFGFLGSSGRRCASSHRLNLTGSQTQLDSVGGRWCS